MINQIVALHQPILRHLVLFSVALFLNLATSPAAQAQTPGPGPSDKCNYDNGKTEGLRVRSLKITARGSRVPPISPGIDGAPLLAVGEPYTSSRLSATMQALKRALTEDHENVDEAFIGSGGKNKSCGVLAVLYISPCPRIVEGGLDVEIIPYFIRLERNSSGKLILPIPRSNRPTLFTQTPRPLLAFNPKFGGDYDRRYGASEKVEITTNLLTLKPMLFNSKELPVEGNTRLSLHVMGRKSLENPFYESDVTLALKRLRPGKVLESISVDGSFTGRQEPWGEGTYRSNIGSLTLNLEAHPEWGILSRITTSAAYHYSGDRFVAGGGRRAERTSESAFEGRAIFEGRLAGGLARLGVWAETSSPNSSLDSYRRVAGLFGYQKEFAIALNQTLGIETLFGAARASGSPPEYARFYGGNSLSNFLYDQADEPALKSFPAGPLLRSFGKGEAGNRIGASLVRGGTSYRHFNMNVTIPVPGWSKPLIPAEVVDEDEGTTLKDIIKGQMGTAESFISSDLQDGGATPEAAQKEAKRIVRQIRPAVNFIADQANIFSIKPLLMFDGANLKVPSSVNNRTRFGIGGGLQLTIVVAKFEAGYMRTVRSLPGDKKGNFVTRIVFQNLF